MTAMPASDQHLKPRLSRAAPIACRRESRDGAWSCASSHLCPAAETTAPLDSRVVEAFLTRHCLDCHSGEEPDGGLDLPSLSRELAAPAALEKWIRIHDRVAAREMPPADSTPPDAAVRSAFTVDLDRALTAAHREQRGTVLRRLNRREYGHTLNDLFGTQVNLAGTLPEDGRSHEFDTVGQVLGLSPVQMQRYLEGIDAVLKAAIVQTLAPPEHKTIRASYADTLGGDKFIGDVWLKLADGAIVFFKQFGYPTGMLREAHVERDGWYILRVNGYAHQSERPITFAVGGTSFAPGAERPTFGYFEFPPGEPTTIELRAYIHERYMVEVTPVGLSDRDNEIQKHGVATYAGPGLAVNWVEVEGPITDEFPSRGHRLVFDGLDRHEALPRNPQERERPWYKPKFEITSDTPDHEVEAVLVARGQCRVPASRQRRADRALPDALSGGA